MGTKILVADDEQAIVALLRDCLADEGYEVACASNGQQALLMAREIHPDLIIADLMMPVLDGAALVRAIQSDPELQNCAVILMSAASRSRLLQESMATALLPKPFDLDDVDRVVAAILTKPG